MSTPNKPTKTAKTAKVATVTPLANARRTGPAGKPNGAPVKASTAKAVAGKAAAPAKAASAKAAPVKATNGKNGKGTAVAAGKPEQTTVRGHLLRAALLAALPHTSEEDDTNPVLASVCLAVTADGRLITSATDNVNAVRITPAAAMANAGKPWRALIPARSIDDLAKRLRRAKEGNVRLWIAPYNGGGKPHLHVQIEHNGEKTAVKLTDGTFPNLEQLIGAAPANSNLTEPIVVDPDRLALFGDSAACFTDPPARMRLFFTGTTNPIRVEIDKLDQAEIVGLITPMKPTL